MLYLAISNFVCKYLNKYKVFGRRIELRHTSDEHVGMMVSRLNERSNASHFTVWNNLLGIFLLDMVIDEEREERKTKEKRIHIVATQI